MKLMQVKSVVLLFALLVGAGVQAQTVPQPPPAIESLESFVIDGWLVAVVKVAKVEGQRVTFAVEETLKGERAAQVELNMSYAYSKNMPDWKSLGNRLLISAKEGSTRIIDLSATDLAVMRADLTLLRTQEEVLKQAREIADRNRGKFGTESYQITAPVGTVAGTSLMSYRYAYLDHVKVNVPVNEMLLAWALTALNSTDLVLRSEGARAFQFFRSDERIARLKQLLTDPAWQGYDWGTDNKIYQRKSYLVREAAYEILTVYWQIPVSKPVLSIPDAGRDLKVPEYLVGWDLSGRTWGEPETKALEEYPNLEDINLTDAQLTGQAIEAISRRSSLQVLHLSGSNVTDADLEKLSKLKNLIYLDLGNTQVTDNGLKVLASMKNLRKVDLGQGVTKKGVDALRKHRPDLAVQEDELSFLSSFKPRREDLPAREARQHLPVALYNRQVLGFHIYALIFPDSSRASVEASMQKELPKRGWVLQRGIYSKPGPLGAKSLLTYSNDEVHLSWMYPMKVGLKPGEFAIMVKRTAWPRN